jgi:predicted secreted hydrolase
MRWRLLLLLLSASTASCIHHSWFHSDRKSFGEKDAAIALRPISRNSLEWWYFNGHLQDSAGRAYAFHTAMFRRYTFPFRYVWMSNTALSDLQRDTIIRHYHFYPDREVQQRTASGPDIRSHGLSYRQSDQGWNLDARESGFRLRLSGSSHTGIIPTAPGGIMHYGNKRAGYLSMPWLEWKGNLHFGDSSIPVSGSGWFDRQWSTLPLTRQHHSWNWISLEHDSFRLMAFGIQDARRDTLYLQGAQIMPNGAVRYFRAEDWMLYGTEALAGDSGSASFPQVWQLWVPELNLMVSMKSKIPDAVITLRALRRPFITYWEGPMEAWGIWKGERFQSRAFVEMKRN